MGHCTEFSDSKVTWSDRASLSSVTFHKTQDSVLETQAHVTGDMAQWVKDEASRNKADAQPLTPLNHRE